MAKIKNVKAFKETVDATHELGVTRDEAKACYDFAREEYKNQEEELCAFAAEHPEVFDGNDGVSGWGRTDKVEYTMSKGSTIERIGKKKIDAAFLATLPKKYLRVKLELNKAKINADKLSAEKLEKLGLIRVSTLSMKLKSSAAVREE